MSNENEPKLSPKDQELADFSKRYRNEVRKMNESNSSRATPRTDAEISAKATAIAQEGAKIDKKQKQMFENGQSQKPEATQDVKNKRGSKVRNLFKKQNQNSQKKGRGR